MKTYRFVAEVTVSVYTSVTAESQAEAEREMEQREMQNFCFQCDGAQAEDCWSLSGGLDGEAQNIRLEGCE